MWIMKSFSKLIMTAVLTMGCIAVNAQSSLTVGQLSRASKQRQQKSYQYNPYSSTNQHLESQTIGTFFVEYNPHTWHVSTGGASTNTSYQGISIGFNYFMPFAGNLGFDAGLKGQYLFRSKKTNGLTNKFEMFSATVPVDLDWRVSDGFAIDPYAGVYGRYNFTAKSKSDISGGGRNTLNWFEKDHVYDTMNRFQFGWQLGVNFRISDMVTIGGAYWMDLNEAVKHTKLRGFNMTLGVNF